jgi:ABC-type phosphate transport system substrate-binding protein
MNRRGHPRGLSRLFALPALLLVQINLAGLASAVEIAPTPPPSPGATDASRPAPQSRPASEPAVERSAAEALRWVVIVHPSSPLRSMGLVELERIYRRRSRFWPNGRAIVAVNLPSSDPLRRAFSSEVLHAGEEELATYWNREYFQGVRPPAVLQSTAAVQAFVAATPSAIGYVTEADVDSTVAVVEIHDGR